MARGTAISRGAHSPYSDLTHFAPPSQFKLFSPPKRFILKVLPQTITALQGANLQVRSGMELGLAKFRNCVGELPSHSLVSADPCRRRTGTLHSSSAQPVDPVWQQLHMVTHNMCITPQKKPPTGAQVVIVPHER